MTVTRRRFLKTTGAGALLAGVPAGWTGVAYASDAPERPRGRIGIIALTDCATIVMAHEFGLFKKHGIESTISKEASWAVIRDRLALGENQATHMLSGMPYASSMGLLGSPVQPMVIPFALKTLALIAHDNKKVDLVARATFNRETLARFSRKSGCRWTSC